MDVDSLSDEKYNVKSLQNQANVTKPSTSTSSQVKVPTAEERKAQAERKKERELNQVEKPNKYCTLLSHNGTKGNNLKATGLAKFIKETFGRMLCEVSRFLFVTIVSIFLGQNSIISTDFYTKSAKMVSFCHNSYHFLSQNGNILADFYLSQVSIFWLKQHHFGRFLYKKCWNSTVSSQ